ncbi:putative F-box protein At3g10240 [Impatiens glandulifera]|uniref:putative F-box protein At3g10240 n=1 Tax=Impatiens glandulifera TaxID=253017 RepID=UPI001FB19FA9|nr:putative F-box protein At3g10240 [Impatiens glandulifera]
MKSLMRLRCVCKLFRSMIDDPYFIKLHHSRSLACPESSTRILIYTIYNLENVDFFSVEIGGDQQAVHCATFPIDYLVSVHYLRSDNVRDRVCVFPQVVKGLVLLKDRIWNPLTGHVTSLPPAEEKDLPEGQPTYRFLGFDPHANQYKVLYISSLSVCKILTIGIDGIIGSWRFIKTYPKEMQSPLLRGCGHDMLYLSNRGDYPSCVLALDLHTEVFHTPSFPVDNISRNAWSIYNAFPGRSVFNYNDSFWRSDGKGGWDKKLDIPRPYKMLGTLGKGEVLLHSYSEEYDDTTLVGFNLETGFLREIHSPRFLREIHTPHFQYLLYKGVETHMECLIRF